MTDLPFRRALVTGAAGFIGSQLVHALARAGVDVHGVVRPSGRRWRLEGMKPTATIHSIDLADARSVAETIEAARPDVVFHAAASSVHHPATAAQRSATVIDSVTATVNLSEAVAGAGHCRLVHLGSFLEYARVPGTLSEDASLGPTTFRGASKAAATLLCRQIVADTGLAAVVLRVFSVYGPWEATNRFVPAIMRAALTGLPLRLTRPGVCHDFVFVADVVDACFRAAAAPDAAGEIFNIGSGIEVANEDVVRTAGDVMGIDVPLSPERYPDRSVDADHYCADISKARRLLGWQPRHSLADGLAATWAWARAHQSLFGLPTASGQ